MQKFLLAAFSVVTFSLGATLMMSADFRGMVLGDTTIAGTTDLPVTSTTNTIGTAPGTTSTTNGGVLSGAAAPAVPVGVTAAATGPTAISVGWKASSGAVRYKVYRNGSVIATIEDTRYTDTVVSAAMKYAYSVAALNSIGTASATSTTVAVSTPAVTATVATTTTTAPATTTAASTTSALMTTATTVSPATTTTTAPATTTMSGTRATSTISGTTKATTTTGTATTTYADPVLVGAGTTSVATGTVNSVTQDVVSGTSSVGDSASSGNAASSSSENSGISALVVSSTAGGTSAASYPFPTVPADVSVATVGPTTIHVKWQASKANAGIATYVIFRDEAQLGTINALSFDDTSVHPGELHEYAVAAQDNVGNLSGRSSVEPVVVPGSERTASSDAAAVPAATSVVIVPGSGEKVVVPNAPVTDPVKKAAVEDRRYAVSKVELVKSDTTGKPVARFSGKALPNSLVTLYIYSDPIVVVVKTDANGNWTYDLDSTLADGNHQVYVAATDSLGRVTAQSSPLPFVKTAQAITTQDAAKLVAPNLSPLQRGMMQFVGAGVALAALFMIVALLIIAKRQSQAVGGNDRDNDMMA